MASVGHKNATAALLLLLLPLMLSSTASEARHKIWHGPIIYASPPPPHPRHHGGLDLPPYIDEQAPAASPEDPAGDSSWVTRKP